MCNNTNYGAVICYSCDAIHRSQGAVAGVRGPWRCLLGLVGGGGLLPEHRAEPQPVGERGPWSPHRLATPTPDFHLAMAWPSNEASELHLPGSLHLDGEVGAGHNTREHGGLGKWSESR